MSGTIFFLNPNSSNFVTARIDAAVDLARFKDGPRLVCETVIDGPDGIHTQHDADLAIAPLLRHAARREVQAAAFVIAAFSDPGLEALRKQSARPVLGIAACGVLTALGLGRRFGVICAGPDAVPRHLLYFKGMGVADRLAANLPLGMTVPAMANTPAMIARMIEVGRILRDSHGADAVVLGGAPMSPGRAELELALGLPVVDCNQAAAFLAVQRVLQGSDRNSMRR